MLVLILININALVCRENPIDFWYRVHLNKFWLLDYAFILLVSLTSGALLRDLAKAALHSLVALISSIAITLLYVTFFFHYRIVINDFNLYFYLAVYYVFKNVFPIPPLLCFAAAIIGAILGEWFKTSVMPLLKSVI